jgi:hypothetical protein
MWTTARLTTYITGAAGALGLILAAMGLADFDHATGMIDLAPFNIYILAGLGTPVVATPVLASLAVLFGWGKKK